MVCKTDGDECELWRRNGSENFSCDHAWMSAKSNSRQHCADSQQDTYERQRKEGITKKCP